MTTQRKDMGTLPVRWGPLVLLLAFLPYPAEAEPLEISLWRRLAQLKEQYQAVSSIHMRARSVLRVSSSESPIMEGSEEYWATGDRYRSNTVLQPTGKKANEWIVAYDGSRWQQYEQASSQMIYKKGNESRQPMCLPNPLLAPVAFVHSPAGENGVKVLWAEAQGEGFWESLERQMQLVSVREEGQGLVAEFRGRSPDGKGFKSRVRFGGKPDHLPRQIDWMPDGSVAFRYIIERYERQVIEEKETYWPKLVRLQVLDAGEGVLTDLSTTVEELTLNRAIPAQTFTLDFTVPAVIFDEDLGVFVKTRGGYRLSPTVVAAEQRIGGDLAAMAQQDEGLAKKAPAAAHARQASGGGAREDKLPDARPARLRWAGVFFVIVAMALILAYVRSRHRARRAGPLLANGRGN